MTKKQELTVLEFARREGKTLDYILQTMLDGAIASNYAPRALEDQSVAGNSAAEAAGSHGVGI